MEIDFTEFTFEDKDDLLDMMAAFNAIDGYHFEREISEKSLIKFIKNKFLGRLFLIKNKQENIGYIVLTFGFSFEYEGRDAFIDEFYIKGNYRNKGVGKKTLEFIERESIKFHVNAIHLEVELHNENANRLYLNQGFKSNNRTLLTKRIGITDTGN